MPKNNSRAEVMITSLDRGLRVLDVLANEVDGLGVSELSRQLKSDKSIVFRTLSLLMQHSYVEQDPVSKKYTLAWKVIQLAGKRIRKMDLHSAAVPVLKEIVRETKEMAILAVMIGDIIAYLHKEEGTQVLNISSGLGQPIPFHSTASGKAILAYLPADERLRILREKGLPRFTQNTITTRSKMERHLEDVRTQGFAVDDGESYPGIRCIAAPVRNFSGAVVGPISVSGPTQRISIERLHFYRDAVIAGARKISIRLGYEEHPGAPVPMGRNGQSRKPGSQLRSRKNDRPFQAAASA
jgi:DNA-binding IclR family transcriptional regulator